MGAYLGLFGKSNSNEPSCNNEMKLNCDIKSYETGLMHHFAMAENAGTPDHGYQMSKLLDDYSASRHVLLQKYDNLCVMKGIEPEDYPRINTGFACSTRTKMIQIKEFIDKNHTNYDIQLEINKMIAANTL